MRKRFLHIFTIALITALQVSGQPGKLTLGKKTIISWLDTYEAELWEAAKYIWDNPELGLQEFKSSEAVASLLERHGFIVKRGVAGLSTAFVATWGSGKPVIGILGEFDALPGLSQQAGVGKESPVVVGAPGHGCGHNIFGVASAGAALGMKAAMEKEHIAGTVKFFGCPAEETLIGKVYMARDGVFNGLDVCLAWHPRTKNQVATFSTLALNNFTVSFYGKTAHGASDPWDGRSALDAVELMNDAVNMMREHVKPTVRIHYTVSNGGGAPNVVPAYAQVWYFVRDIDREGVEHVYNRIMKVVEGVATATETTYKVDFLTGCYQVNSNEVLSKALYKNFSMIGPPQWAEEDQAIAKSIQKGLCKEPIGMPDSIETYKPVRRVAEGGGSTDVGDVSWICPLAQINVASNVPGSPAHHWSVVSSNGSDLGRKALLVAAKVLGTTGLDMLTQPEILEEAWEEFNKVIEGKPYKSPLPANQPPPKELPH